MPVPRDWKSMVVMDITTDNQVYLTCYDFTLVNSQMDKYEGTFLKCADITDLATDWGSSTLLSSLLPESSSVQGLAMDAEHNVYISSGSKDTGAWIGKSAWGGSTFNQQHVVPSSEDSGPWTNGEGIVEIEGIQLYYDNVNATVTKHLSTGDKSYIYQFPETQF